MSPVLHPLKAQRRSPIYRWHMHRGATFIAKGDATFVQHYQDSEKEGFLAQRLAICDLSLLSRQGIIGRGSSAWLTANRQVAPECANKSVTQANGDLLVRLAERDFLNLQLSSLGFAGSPDRDMWLDGGAADAFIVPSSDSHSLFAVSGTFASTLFSKICGVDLRERSFSNGDVAQTSVARVNAVIIRHHFGSTENFFLLTATSAAEYVWHCLLDAMQEYGGEPVGVAALAALQQT